MYKTLTRWSIPLASFLLVGPLAGLLLGGLRSKTGAPDASPLVSESPIFGLLAALGCMLLAGVMGLLGAKLVHRHNGLFCAGLVLVWPAWQTGTIDAMIRDAQSGAIAWRLGVEGAILGGVAALLALIILKVGRPEHAGITGDHASIQPAQASGKKSPGSSKGAPRAGIEGEPEGKFALMIAGAAACVGAAVGAWIVAGDTLKGQAFAAAAAAGIAAALAGRLASKQAHASIFFAALAVLAAASPVAAALVHSGDAEIIKASYRGSLIPLARILPMDWIAGAFIGIPIGLGWASSFSGEGHHHTAR